MKFAAVNQTGHVLAEFETFAEADAYTARHARSIVVYTRSGKRPTVDMHVVELARLDHYRQQLKEALA